MKLSKAQRIAIPIFAIIVIVLIAVATSTTAHLETGVYGTVWSLMPPIIAIGLALITKEVYISLFVGIASGAFLQVGGFGHPVAAVETIFGTILAKLGDAWNIGILIFLVILGVIVILMNKAGGSKAYGDWARRAIKTRRGAQLATFILGVVIFVDDYFNCLTVGSVMRPVTDGHKISRAKLAYLIDATAAPVCIIAPISSWAAAVSGMVEGANGLVLFIRAIPYNYYALLTLLMIIVISILNIDYGPMKTHEDNAQYHDDLYTTPDRPYADANDEPTSSRGRVADLILPVIVLIICCIIGLMYTGGFFGGGVSIVDAFANSDASVGLMLGSFVAILFAFIYFLSRRVLSFRQFADSLPEGFKAMVPAILILTFAWSISGITSNLGAAEFVANAVHDSAAGFQMFLPAIIFLIACGLAFATGTSWGTFGILIPIVVEVFPNDSEILIIAIAACLGGAVMGDHISPISDTTIMASTGAQCNHINHVATQIPYAITVTVVAFISYILAGFIQNVFINLIIASALMVVVLLVIRKVSGSKTSGAVK